MSKKYFYRTLGTDYGPVSLELIQKLLDQGTLGSGDQFREIGGSWRDIVDLPETSLDDVARPTSNDEMKRLFAECLDRRSSQNPKPVRVQSRSLFNGLSGALGSVLQTIFSHVTDSANSLTESTVSILGRVVRSKIAWTAIVILLLAIMIPISAPTIMAASLTQPQIHRTLVEMFAEIKELRSKDVDVNARDDIKKRSETKLALLLPNLKRHARVEDRASMSMMWIARDFLPSLLNATEEQSSALEEKIQVHFNVVDAALKKVSQSTKAWDIGTTFIVGVDVLGACAALVYFGRSWLNR